MYIYIYIQLYTYIHHSSSKPRARVGSLHRNWRRCRSPVQFHDKRASFELQCNPYVLFPGFPLIPHVSTDMLEWEANHMPFVPINDSTSISKINDLGKEFWIHLSTDVQIPFSIASARIMYQEKNQTIWN